MRIVVLGAGALGCAAALHASRAGHEVSLVDATGVAGGTSGLGAGIFSFALVDDLDRRMVQASLRAAANARQGRPLVEMQRPGSHHLASTKAEREALGSIQRGLDELGEPADGIDGEGWTQAMARRGLDVDASGVRSVLRTPSDAWVDGGSWTRALADAALRAGCRLVAGAQASNLLMDPGTDFPAVGGVRLTDGRRIEADRVVVALGAWTRGLLESQGLDLPTVAYRTHGVLVEPREPLDVPILHDAPNHYYLRPAADGRVLLGDGTVLDPVEPQDFPIEPDAAVPADILGRAARRIPALEEARIERAWRGLLTAVPDRRPLVGPHPEADGLVICAGGNGFGLMRSWALGELAVASASDGARPAWAPADVFERLDPARFWPDPPGSFPVREGFTLTP